MRPTYQHKLIADHLQKTLGRTADWPFSSALEIEDELCRQELSLCPGEYLVVIPTKDHGRFGKVRDLKGFAEFPRASFVISYQEIERRFHEHYEEWVEL
jgi:hypothetical protein